MKKRLHNNICNKILKKNILQEKSERITISFYKYFIIEDINNFRNEFYLILDSINVFGRIYISHEGINAQISVLQKNYIFLKKIIRGFNPLLKDVFFNQAIDDNGKSFWSLKIKIRKYIVVDKIKNINFDFTKTGKYLLAEEINNMIDKKDVFFIDIRNNYEYEIGHFYNALKITANNFSEQLIKLIYILKNKKNKKIVLYCTGGIRCEKASAWMKFNGFKNVYQVKGGILEYIRQTKKNNLPRYFKGNIFVFDLRMKENISDEIISYCYQCKNKCDNYINCKNNKCHFLFIQCQKCAKIFKQCCSLSCIKKLVKS